MLMRFAYVLIVTACAALVPKDASAQPPPSFSAPCGALRAAIAKLDRSDEGLITIQVEGVARRVHFDGALAYFLLCTPPDPQVLCVTYGTGDRKAGDKVIVTGTFTQRDPDFVLLDPCLPDPPGE